MRTWTDLELGYAYLRAVANRQHLWAWILRLRMNRRPGTRARSRARSCWCKVVGPEVVVCIHGGAG